MYSPSNIVYECIKCILLFIKFVLTKLGLLFNIDIEYYFAKCGWFYMKVYSQCLRLLNQSSHDNSRKPYILVKDGDYTQVLSCPDTPDDYDMILYESNDTTHRKNVVRIDNGEYKNNFEKSKAYVLGVKINLIDEKGNKQEYDVDFGNDNFFIIGNTIFDRAFVQYWLKRYHGVPMFSGCSYEISFIDHNIESCIVKDPNSITFSKDNYIINIADDN